ncbi:MAG: ribosomal protein S18-alanine N-acetyltransferase [Candidatus Methanomethylicaceae archaeon]
MDDLDEIYKIEKESFPDPYPKGLLKAFLFFPGAYLVALSEGLILGYAIGVVRYETVGHIISIAVSKEKRRSGVGRQLLAKSVERLRLKGVQSVRLEVRESNVEAIDLYKKAGFLAEDKIEGYYVDGESALVMYLSVK